MPLTYHPRPGEIFICDYPKDLSPPEMVKNRPVVVVSPRFRHRNNLVTVVPLSATPPAHPMPYHFELTLPSLLPAPWNTNPCWAICDHPMAVSFARLNLIRIGKDQYGKRKYYQQVITTDNLNKIRACIMHSIGLSP